MGTIDDYIKEKYTGAMPPETNGLHHMASGLDFIHREGFVHRDIKPENVLISPSIVLKISDFGFCKPVSSSGSFSTTSGSKGTPVFTAPEYLLLDGKSKEERERIRANVSIDIFSLGCLFYCYIKKGGHLFNEPGSQNRFSIIPNIVEGKKYLKEGKAVSYGICIKYGTKVNRTLFLYDKQSGLNLDHYAYEIIDEMTQALPGDRWKLQKVISALESHLIE